MFQLCVLQKRQKLPMTSVTVSFSAALSFYHSMVSEFCLHIPSLFQLCSNGSQIELHFIWKSNICKDIVGKTHRLSSQPVRSARARLAQLVDWYRQRAVLRRHCFRRMPAATVCHQCLKQQLSACGACLMPPCSTDFVAGKGRN